MCFKPSVVYFSGAILMRARQRNDAESSSSAQPASNGFDEFGMCRSPSSSPAKDSPSKRKRLLGSLRSMGSLRSLRSYHGNSKPCEESPIQTPVKTERPSLALNFEISPSDRPIFDSSRNFSNSSSLNVLHSSPINIVVREAPKEAEGPESTFQVGTVPESPAPILKSAVQEAILSHSISPAPNAPVAGDGPAVASGRDFGLEEPPNSEMLVSSPSLQNIPCPVDFKGKRRSDSLTTHNGSYASDSVEMMSNMEKLVSSFSAAHSESTTKLEALNPNTLRRDIVPARVICPSSLHSVDSSHKSPDEEKMDTRMNSRAARNPALLAPSNNFQIPTVYVKRSRKVIDSEANQSKNPPCIAVDDFQIPIVYVERSRKAVVSGAHQSEDQTHLAGDDFGYLVFDEPDGPQEDNQKADDQPQSQDQCQPGDQGQLEHRQSIWGRHSGLCDGTGYGSETTSATPRHSSSDAVTEESVHEEEKAAQVKTPALSVRSMAAPKVHPNESLQDIIRAYASFGGAECEAASSGGSCYSEDEDEATRTSAAVAMSI